MYIVNLYNVRWKRKYTHEEISQATGLSRKTVGQLFSGKHYDFQLSTLEKMCKFFDCDLHDILIKVDDDF